MLATTIFGTLLQLIVPFGDVEDSQSRKSGLWWHDSKLIKSSVTNSERNKTHKELLAVSFSTTSFFNELAVINHAAPFFSLYPYFACWLMSVRALAKEISNSDKGWTFYKVPKSSSWQVSKAIKVLKVCHFETSSCKKLYCSRRLNERKYCFSCP